MTAPSSYTFLSAHHLLYQVLTLVERAESHAVMVTAYLEPWPNLELVLRQAVARGVAVHIVTRSIDDTHNDKAKRAKAIDRVRALGVTVHEVDWLHTKLYVSEKEAIVASLNLTAGGHDSPNLGLHLHGGVAAMEALQQIDQWLPNFSIQVAALATTARNKDASAFCIRCQGARPIFNPSKPYCSDCWGERKLELSHKVESCCHRCGAKSETTLRQPLCGSCAGQSEQRMLAVV